MKVDIEKYPLPDPYFWYPRKEDNVAAVSVPREERHTIWTWTDSAGRLTVRGRWGNNGNASIELACVETIEEACQYMSAYMMLGMHTDPDVGGAQLSFVNSTSRRTTEQKNYLNTRSRKGWNGM